MIYDTLAKPIAVSMRVPDLMRPAHGVLYFSLIVVPICFDLQIMDSKIYIIDVFIA